MAEGKAGWAFFFDGEREVTESLIHLADPHAAILEPLSEYGFYLCESLDGELFGAGGALLPIDFVAVGAGVFGVALFEKLVNSRPPLFAFGVKRLVAFLPCEKMFLLFLFFA